MSCGFVRHPANSEHDLHAANAEIDRWRTAVEIVKRMREAGIACELSDALESRH